MYIGSRANDMYTIKYCYLIIIIIILKNENLYRVNRIYNQKQIMNYPADDVYSSSSSLFALVPTQLLIKIILFQINYII